jgi:hypothetical protein
MVALPAVPSFARSLSTLQFETRFPAELGSDADGAVVVVGEVVVVAAVVVVVLGGVVVVVEIVVGVVVDVVVVVGWAQSGFLLFSLLHGRLRALPALETTAALAKPAKRAARVATDLAAGFCIPL